MGIEIQRKFLVVGEVWRQGAGVSIKQGYLSRDKDRTVRIRVAGPDAFLTVKGVSIGMSRAEFEYPIPVRDALEMLAICEGPLVEKTRYIVWHAGEKWEIDEFEGENLGLVVAEVELQSERQSIELPPWVGPEVTDDPRYFNSRLAITPFNTWSHPL